MGRRLKSKGSRGKELKRKRRGEEGEQKRGRAPGAHVPVQAPQGAQGTKGLCRAPTVRGAAAEQS